MEKMYIELEKVNEVIDGVFATLVQNSAEDRYMARMVHARFTLNSSKILSDLKEIEKIGDDDALEVFLESYFVEFKSAFRTCFISKHGFGSLMAERYASCAAASMSEVIDSWLAIARQ